MLWFLNELSKNKFCSFSKKKQKTKVTKVRYAETYQSLRKERRYMYVRTYNDDERQSFILSETTIVVVYWSLIVLIFMTPNY